MEFPFLSITFSAGQNRRRFSKESRHPGSGWSAVASIADIHTTEEKETQLQLALRPYVTTGVALVGASVIAATPIAPAPTQTYTQVHSQAVQLTAASSFVDPVTRWIQVFEATATNLTELRNYIFAHPERSVLGLLELLQAKINGYGNALFGQLPQVAESLGRWATKTLLPGMQTAFQQLVTGQPEAASKTFRNTVMSLISISSPLFGLMGFVTVPTMIMQDIVDITRSFTAPIQLLSWVSPIMNLVWSPILSLGTSAQRVIDAVEAGDLLGAVGAVLNAPADAVDHFLNSPGGLVEFRTVGSSGILTAGGLLTALLIKIPQAIQVNLDPPLPVTAAAADTSVATGTMVSLETSTPGVEGTEPAAASQPAGPFAEETPDNPESPAAPVDETEMTEEPAEDIDDAELAEVPAEEIDEAEEPNGATDLSDGNKVEPGESGVESTPDDESESSADGVAGDDSDTAGASDTTGSDSDGGDAGGTSDGSDRGSES